MKVGVVAARLPTVLKVNLSIQYFVIAVNAKKVQDPINILVYGYLLTSSALQKGNHLLLPGKVIPGKI